MSNESNTAKAVVSVEILEMLNKCIDMAGRVKDASYRLHFADNVKAAGAQGMGITEKKPVDAFSISARDKIMTIQEILRDTIQTMEDFV